MAAGRNGGRGPAASSLTRRASSAPAASPMAAAVPAPCACAAARPPAPDARKRGNPRENVPRRASLWRAARLKLRGRGVGSARSRRRSSGLAGVQNSLTAKEKDSNTQCVK